MSLIDRVASSPGLKKKPQTSLIHKDLAEPLPAAEDWADDFVAEYEGTNRSSFQIDQAPSHAAHEFERADQAQATWTGTCDPRDELAPIRGKELHCDEPRSVDHSG